MKPLFEDTSPEAEKVLIEGIRARSAAQRFAVTRALTGRTVTLALRAIRRAHRDLSEAEARILFIELYYGRDLAEALKTRASLRPLQ